MYPAQLTAKNVLLTTNPVPDWLMLPISPVLKDLGIFEESPHVGANHILVNQYEPGEGIMPHEDGDAYYPATATISLGSHTVLNLYEKNADGERQDKPTWWILQEPRSLLVTRGEAYKVLLHGIDEVKYDEDLGPQSITNWDALGNKSVFETGTCERGVRTSLTCRDVTRVSKLGGRLLGKR